MLKIAICDDDENILDISYNILSKEFNDCLIKKFNDSNKLLDKVKEYNFFDIYILDIEMPKVSGVEMIKEIQKYQHNAIVIFLTGYMEYAVEAYEFGLFRYIMKNSMQEKLIKYVYEAIKMIDLDEGFLLLKREKQQFKIKYKDIIYINKDLNDAVFHTNMGNFVEHKKTLTEIMENLKSDKFQFIEKGFVVNIAFVDCINENNLVLTDGSILPVSRRKKSDLKNCIMKYWRDKL